MTAASGENSWRLDALSIGAWLLRPDLNRIERDGAVVHLEPKAVAILCLLAERGGEVVSRQELLDLAWAGTVVSDDALTQVVIKLRKALGDDSRSPSYIQTIPKRGYRLLAPVEQATPGRGSTRRMIMPALALLTGLALAGAVYLLSGKVEQARTTETGSEAGRAIVDDASIAVLPFDAIDQGERGLNFARGITADLSTDLSKLPGLWVINTQDQDGLPGQVRYLVSGSVQYVPERISVHVHLLEAESRRQLWSERYERPLIDLFDVQRVISEEIARRLELEVNAADRERLARRYTLSVPAYEDFLRGQAELLLRQRPANENARLWYRRAIEKDPAFARAYAGLALSYAADFRNQWVEDGQQALNQAVATASTAEQIDPSIPEVHWVLGYVDTQKRNLEAARTRLQKALDLDRSYADAYALLGGIETYRGQPGLSIAQLRQAMRLKPSAGYLYYLLLGRAYFFLGQDEQALINLREALSRNPDNLEARIYLAATAVATGDLDTARWEAEEIRVMNPGFDLRAWLETYPMTDQSQIQQLTRALAGTAL